MGNGSVVATNLVGRWATGLFRRKNPDHVPGEDEWGRYTKAQKKTLTEHQMSEYVYDKVVERIVAVTTEGEGDYAELVFWALKDGKPKIIRWATIMPPEWTPEIPR